MSQRDVNEIMSGLMRSLNRHFVHVIPFEVVMTVIAIIMIAACLCGLCGCVQPNPEIQPAPRPPVIIDDSESEKDQPLTLTVSAADSLLATLHETLGDSGSLTINPAAPIIIHRPQATLTIKPGTQLKYNLTAAGGTISFGEPKPSVSASVWGIKMTPQLSRVELRPDNTGTAHVESGPLKLSRQFSLGWLESSGTPATTEAELPVVRIYSADWCAPCQQAEREFAAATDLPFRVVIINEDTAAFPSWVTALPTLHWQSNAGWRQATGWSDLPTFLARWRANTTPKKPPENATK
jgi:hypothetical protein